MTAVFCIFFPRVSHAMIPPLFPNFPPLFPISSRCSPVVPRLFPGCSQVVPVDHTHIHMHMCFVLHMSDHVTSVTNTFTKLKFKRIYTYNIAITLAICDRMTHVRDNRFLIRILWVTNTNPIEAEAHLKKIPQPQGDRHPGPSLSNPKLRGPGFALGLWATTI